MLHEPMIYTFFQRSLNYKKFTRNHNRHKIGKGSKYRRVGRHDVVISQSTKSTLNCEWWFYKEHRLVIGESAAGHR